MCRLLGISYGENGEREEISTHEIASILYLLLTKGGPHAYGWMSYNEQTDEISYAKSPGRADSQEAFDWFADEIDDDAAWFVGHTRYATDGDPSDNRNNHPIWHGNVVGVHNGVLSGWSSVLKETGREDPEAKVDSEAIFAAVNKWGAVEGMKKIYGSAVTLFATLDQPDVLMLARTHGRSITLGWTEKGNMIWASEEEALLSLEHFGIKFKSITKVSENRLLLIKNGKIIHKARFRPIPQPVTDWKRVDALLDRYAMEDRLALAQGKDPMVPTDLPDNDDDFYIAAQMRRAQKRGKAIFGKDHPRRNADGSRKLVYYKGEYITIEEHEEIMDLKR